MSDKPILRVENDIREINKKLNTIIIDSQSIKSDIAEIKRMIKEKEKVERMAGGWWMY
tara:strand:- start:189 stop:362 length:174 start_codon:yes stop_codon:yes gene_type:complete